LQLSDSQLQLGLGKPLLNLIGGLQSSDLLQSIDRLLPAAGLDCTLGGGGKVEEALITPGLFQLFKDVRLPWITPQHPLKAFNCRRPEVL
jgi:hypothetical protein